MSKYEPLTAFLKSKAGREVRMSFAEIEVVIGQKLPERSKVQRAWWSNNPSNNVMTKAWLAAGYKTEQVDVASETLSFVPNAKRPRSHPAFGSMKGTTTIMPGVDLTEPADPDWGKVYDDDYNRGVVDEPRNGGFKEVTQTDFNTDGKAKLAEAGGKKPYRHPAFGALKGMITLLPDMDYTAPADPDWGKVYDD